MAIPAILQQLGKNQMTQALGPIKQMIGMIRTAQNPQAMINQLMMTNPQMKQVMEIVRQHGGDPMAAFRAEAQDRGVDPDEIMNMLK